jgi:hypothetical protein
VLASTLGLAVLACGGTPRTTLGDQVVGQTEFQSRPANAAGPSRSGDGFALGSTDNAAVSPGASQETNSAKPRTVEETDLYRLEGDRLYYLNSYRGLMVFDVSQVDAPKLLGRSPIYGDPVEMIVRNGIASVVVSDWYGTTEDSKPFHGSVVRGIDATDPKNMKILGQAMLGGWVRDTRVVGDVLYAVTEQYNYDSVWYGSGVAVSGGASSSVAVGSVSSSSGAEVAVTSVNYVNGAIAQVDRYEVPGQGGLFNVTPNSILLASSELGAPDQYGYRPATGRTILKYLDISDPAGDIRERGQAIVDGTVQGWGADNGRWNLDFADGKTAHALACVGQYCGNNNGLTLSTLDFSNADVPVLKSTLAIPASTWSPTARFDGTRMYLSPSQSGCYYYSGTSQQSTTPVQIYDLSDPSAPRFAGSTDLDGQIWLFMPAGNRLFALGNQCTSSGDYYGSNVSLGYLDVTNPAAPSVIGTASFGQGWAWTPAANTFKAFTKDDTKGLVVLPFSGWDSSSYQYNNGVQLIEFTDTSIATSGAAKSRGWVERGIFVGNRLVSLSDLSLAVIDYTDHAQPKVVSELTLARNVVDVKPQGDTVAELSSDFWDNDQRHSTLRILPSAQAEENVADATLSQVEIDGYNSRVFHNANLSYVVSNIQTEVSCDSSNGNYSGPKGAGDTACYNWTQEIQVIDRTGGAAVKRGKVDLPISPGYGYSGWGWYGCYAWDWYGGSDVLQVNENALVFRRWLPRYAQDGAYLDSSTALYVVDLTNPDSPSLASTLITDKLDAWWGNMRTVKDKLYVGHYEWVNPPYSDGQRYDPGVVRYYLDQIDLSDRAHPRIGTKINVPGILVGANEDDPSIIFTMDYQWVNDQTVNRFNVLRLEGDHASLLGWQEIPGWVGNTFVQGSTAYFSVQSYDNTNQSYPLSLYQVDVSNPSDPKILPSQPTQGWGWLLGVQGDRAFVTSGWGNVGIDVFRLEAGKAPVFDKFVRVRGWWANSLARQNNQLFIASGYWGTQVVDL